MAEGRGIVQERKAVKEDFILIFVDWHAVRCHRECEDPTSPGLVPIRAKEP
jgi:hypothetical protein